MRFVSSRRGQLTAVVVDQGRQAGHRLGVLFGELVEIALDRTEGIGKFVRAGTDRQLAVLGLVTRADLVAFEPRLRVPAAKTSPARKPVVKRDTAPKAATAATTRRAR